MLRRLLTLACLLCALTAPAQNPQPAPKPETPPTPATGRITGIITCADTHAPARGATVLAQTLPGNIYGFKATRASTDVNGHYVITGLEPGEYVVSAHYLGYIHPLDDTDTRPDGVPYNREETIAQQRSLGTVKVSSHHTATQDRVLERGAAISGHILFADGSPANLVRVDAENAGTERRVPINPRDIHYTDDTGHYRLPGLKPGTYRLSVIAPRQEVTTAGDYGEDIAYVDHNPLHIYSGNTWHRDLAKTYTLRAADEATADIILPLSGLHMVAGLVTAADGRALNLARLTLTDRADKSLTLATDLANDGSYNFGNVPPGTYTLSISEASIGVPLIDPKDPDEDTNQLKPAFAFAPATRDLIVADSDLTNINFALTPAPLPPPAPNQQ